MKPPRSRKDAIYRVLLIISTIILSFFSGLYTGTVLMLPRHEIQQIGEINPKITLVSFDKIESGQLIGHVEGQQARLKTRSNVTVPAINDTFQLDLSDLGVFSEDVEPIDVPEDAKFVASKNGKKIYSLTSKAGKKINPNNRIYFSSVYEAMSQGFRK